MDKLLYEPRLIPHLIVDALGKYDEHPCLYLGGATATYKDVRYKVSQYAQALNKKAKSRQLTAAGTPPGQGGRSPPRGSR